MIAEFNLLGTHLGDLRGVPPTGRAFTCRMLAIFEFETEGDGIVCERVYFDTGTIARQLSPHLSFLFLPFPSRGLVGRRGYNKQEP